MMKENLFVYIEWSLVKQVILRFFVRKNVIKKKKKNKKIKRKWKLDGISQVQGLSVSYPEAPCIVLC